MPSYPVPANEAERLAVLHEWQAEEVLSAQSMDDLTALAAHICEAPMAFITLVKEDRQLLLSPFGGLGGARETPREVAFCAHAIMQPDLFVVTDMATDSRFSRHPLVVKEPRIRFYAGAPLNTPTGAQLGTLCVLDHVPRQLTEPQQQALAALSRHVVTQLRLHHSDRMRRAAEEELKTANASLEKRVQERTEALLEAQERLAMTIRAGNIGLWEYDFRQRQYYHSPGLKAQLGFRDEEMPSTGVDWSQHMHPDDVARCAGATAACLRDGPGDFECELRFRHKDGSYRWMLSRGRLVRSSEGEPLRLLGCHIDLTERRGMEESLRRSQEELRELYGNLQTVREEEKQRMARELHDELGAQLTGLKFDVAWMQRQIARALAGEPETKLQERLAQWEGNLDQIIRSVRQVCQELRPPTLELGLLAALEWQVHEFTARTGLPCALSLPESTALDADRSMVVFRVLQELLTNITRHAQAAQVEVRMEESGGEVLLEVADDGLGLPAEGWDPSRHFGLRGLKERVRAVQGSVQWHSTPGAGTRVTIRVPLP